MSLPTPRTVVTAGASMFADALTRQAVDVVAVDWRPPVADPVSLAAVMADPRRPGANAQALAAMLGAQAHLVDVRPASEALGLERGRLLHAGPPVDWERASGPMRGALVGALLFEGWAADADEAERLLATTAAARSARWPGWCRRRCGCSACATSRRVTSRGAR